MVPRDLVEAGAHEAGRALALLLRRADVPVTAIDDVSPAELAARVGPRAVVVGFTVSGGMPGRFAVVTSEAHAQKLADALVGAPGADGALGRRALGALTELSNIGASAYLNGVARALDTACVPSVPSVIVDDAGKALALALGVDGTVAVSVARLDAGGVFVELCLIR